MTEVALGVHPCTGQPQYQCSRCGRPVGIPVSHDRRKADRGVPVVCTGCRMQEVMRDIPEPPVKKLRKGQQKGLFS